MADQIDLNQTTVERTTDRDSGLSKPPLFDGDRSKTESFVSKCSIYLEGNEKKFESAKSKILFFLSYLTGEAELWGRDWLESRPTTTTDGETVKDYGTFKDFGDAFLEAFEPVDAKVTALIDLKSFVKKAPEQPTMPLNSCS